MLLPPASDSLAGRTLREGGENPYDSSEHPFWKSVAGQPITPETTLFMLRKKWRIDQDTLAEFKAILEMFVGTHNFWNFTVGREFKEAASKRIMKSIQVCQHPYVCTGQQPSDKVSQVEEPFVYSDTEWLSIRIHGQSFMLHQVRDLSRLEIIC